MIDFIHLLLTPDLPQKGIYSWVKLKKVLILPISTPFLDDSGPLFYFLNGACFFTHSRYETRIMNLMLGNVIRA